MSHPLASYPIAKTRDTDEAQSVLSRELSELRFRSVRDRSRFRFEMNGIRLGQTMVAFNRFSTEAEVDAGVIDSAVIVSLSVGPPAVLDLDGEHVGSDRLGVVSPSRRLIVKRAPGSGVVLLRTGIDALRQRYRELTGRELTRPMSFDRSVELNRGVAAQIQLFLSHLVNDARNTDTILNNPVLRAGFDDMLLSAILSLPGTHSDKHHVGPDALVPPSIVRQAEEFLEAHATEPITISDVVVECGCSRRALFQSFRRYRGYTPMQFLSETRLKCARDMLLHPLPNDTVTSIAIECGFSHTSRFAEAYRKRFGEKPSETMRRA